MDYLPIRRAERFDRLLRILTLAYWLLLGVGLAALGCCAAGMWSSNNPPGACGLFFIGRKMIGRLQRTFLQAVTALLEALFLEAKNWG